MQVLQRNLVLLSERMDLIADANILFAAFIRNSTTRMVLLTRTPIPLKLYVPPFIFEEAYKYRKLLAKKTNLEENEIMALLFELISASNIEILKEKDLFKFKDESEVVSPRKNDAPYFASALYKNCGIWSNDRPLKGQKRIIIINTAELLAILDGNENIT